MQQNVYPKSVLGDDRLTLTFQLFRARKKTRLPCEFGANPFRGSSRYFIHKQKVTGSAKTEPYAVYCVR